MAGAGVRTQALCRQSLACVHSLAPPPHHVHGVVGVGIFDVIVEFLEALIHELL